MVFIGALDSDLIRPCTVWCPVCVCVRTLQLTTCTRRNRREAEVESEASMRKKKRSEAELLQARLERDMMAALLAPAKVSMIFRGTRNQHLLQTHSPSEYYVPRNSIDTFTLRRRMRLTRTLRCCGGRRGCWRGRRRRRGERRSRHTGCSCCGYGDH